MTVDAQQIEQHLRALADPERADSAKRFFKSGPGEYGETDELLGINVPVIREQVKRFKPVPLDVCLQLLKSSFHEIRMFALLSMVVLFKLRKPDSKKAVFEAYLKNTRYINNWDLVDCSCYHIVGPYLAGKGTEQLTRLAKSSSLWERRIAMVSTYHNIKTEDYQPTLLLADILLHDDQDLMHKAVGWMLKEVGRRDQALLIEFLKPRYRSMPRTMLRTAIEKMDKNSRQAYLKGEV